MKKLSEGRKMFVSVMVVFAVYAVIFILFEDYDRKFLSPFDEVSDWHLLLFSLAVMGGLALLLHRYGRRMDERISRDQMEKQGATRRQMTQNIAHELRTPVASILGYTDTILENPDIDEETMMRFVRRTNSQARRLSSLLNDLSTLNGMDCVFWGELRRSEKLEVRSEKWDSPEGAADLRRGCQPPWGGKGVGERIDVSELVADIVDETAIAVASKQMTVENCLPEDVCIRGNWSLIYGVFRNLVDNAINYAGTGVTVRLSATEGADCWCFTVADNGVGVASEHLPHLFERFYRVDKGRSRQLGGTGLGLAIVKNAVVLHGGRITVSNVPTGGLRFDFTLPFA